MTISLNLSDEVVAAARKMAETENTSLEEIFERSMLTYAERSKKLEYFKTAVEDLRQVFDTSGPRPTREEMNRRGLL